MGLLKKNAAKIAFVALLMTMLLGMSLFMITPAVASAEEDGPTPYWSESIDYNVNVGGGTVHVVLNGDDLLWPNTDKVNYTVESQETFSYTATFKFEYHGEFSHVDDRYYSSVSFCGAKAKKYEGKALAETNGAAKKYNVQKCDVTLTFTLNGETVTSTQTVLFEK